MEAALEQQIREQMRFEGERNGPPERWPILDDLPLGRYTDPEFYELEREHLWKRVWSVAAHQSELPEIGSYKTLDMVGAPIVLVRGQDGEVRAFFNACRHRGAPVVRDECGTERRLRCQFHSWSYDLGGQLVAVPDQRDFSGLDLTQRSLVEIRTESWAGLIFVNQDPDAPSLREWLGPVATELEELEGIDGRVAQLKTTTVGTNWKVVAEAFLETYHLNTVHPKTVGTYIDHRRTAIGLLPNGHSRMITPLHEAILERYRGRSPFPDLDFPELQGLYKETDVAYGIFPNLITPIEYHGFPLLVFWPLGVNQTRLDEIWIGKNWGDGERPASWDKKLSVFDQVMQEDYRNLEPIQRSIEAAAHGGAPLSYQERRIQHFHETLDTMIGPERIPAHLTVTPALAGTAFVE